MSATKRLKKTTRYRLGADIGGTFTDLVILGDDGFCATRKIPSTPDDYADGIVAGLKSLIRECEIDPRHISGVVHATTVATNAIIEQKGAKTALITTQGFRDVLELRRIRIPVLYDLTYVRPPPLVPRRLRFEVDERIGPKGEIRQELDRESVYRVLAQIADEDVEALAVCLLHSYANPAHETLVTGLAREKLPDLFVSGSYEILPEIREYERTSSTVVNAYVGPILHRYLLSLTKKLKVAGVAAPLQVLQSGGGLMTAQSAIRKPAHIIESGPAAGVVAAAWMAGTSEYENLLTFDMGGTTAKAAMIEEGRIGRTFEYEVGSGINLSSQLVKGGGHAVKLPFIDVSEIGAGGGSLVSVDSDGRLSVGPDSAGADPGPICYGRGGQMATFTDAVLCLGYLNPDRMAGGEISLSPDRTREMFMAQVAGPLNLDLQEAAYGVFTLACSKMIRAVKAISTYRGRDPREFALFAFGGNGPVAAVEIARSLQMKQVVVPPNPGVFSAFGLLVGEIRHEFVHTLLRDAESVSWPELETHFARLEAEARDVFAGEGCLPEEVDFLHNVDLRYTGQTFELTVNITTELAKTKEMPALSESFEQEHLRTYGHRGSGDPIQIVNLRVTGRSPPDGTATLDPSAVVLPDHSAEGSETPVRQAYFGPEYGLLETLVLSRMGLRSGIREGPCIVEEYDSTCVVPPACKVSLDRIGNMVIQLEEGRHVPADPPAISYSSQDKSR